MSRAISFDTETYYDDECSVKKLGNSKYVKDPLFECYMISVCDGENTWVGHPSKFNFASLDGATLVSFNAGFDQAVGRSVAPINPAAWHCAGNLAAYLCGLRSLDKTVEHFYGTQVSKGMRNYMKKKRWDNVPPEKQKEMIEYARGDAYWCHKTWVDQSPMWPEHERELSRITIDEGAYGVGVDTDLLKKYSGWIAHELFEIGKDLPWIERGAKPTSTIAIAEECRKVGIACPPVKDEDEDAFIEWETRWAPQFPWVKGIGLWRSATKVKRTLEAFQSRLRDDNTIESPLLYFAAHTGRWGGTGGLNFQNFRKYPFLCRVRGALEELHMRHLLVPRPGKKFIICDLGQIEPRILAWITKNAPLLEMMGRGINIYEAYARNNGQWSGNGDMKSQDKKGYALKKVQVLQLGYGCGWEKFQSTAASDYDVILSDEEALAAVQDFRAQNPLIAGEDGLWSKLDNAFKNSLDNDFEMELPSGRTMRYRDVRRIRVPRKQKDGTTKQKWAFTAQVVKSGYVQRLPFYGGMLLENLIQATARDVFSEHLRDLVGQGFRVPFHAHDEAIVECDPDVEPRDIEQIMSRTPDWLEGCPLAAEAQNAEHYCK